MYDFFNVLSSVSSQQKESRFYDVHTNAGTDPSFIDNAYLLLGHL